MSNDSPPIAEATPGEAFAAISSNATARLVDVRTRAEWTFTGVPDVGEAGADPVLIEWQTYPTMQVDDRFGDALQEACPDKSAPLYFLCRSGVRSLAAARLARELGYERCYNITNGFEGPPDAEGHRGQVAGWKANRLPWRQS